MAIIKATERIERINHAARVARMHWLESALSNLWHAKEEAVQRWPHDIIHPDWGVMTLTASDGWQNHRRVCRVCPFKDAWLIDDAGQLYLFTPDRPNKPIPYSQTALRDRSLARFDRDSMRGQLVEPRDMELAQLMQDMRLLFAKAD